MLDVLGIEVRRQASGGEVVDGDRAVAIGLLSERRVRKKQ